MKKLWPFLLLAAGFVIANRSCDEPIEWPSFSSPSQHSADAVPGGPVRAMEAAPKAIHDMQDAMPESAPNSKVMRDTVTRGLNQGQ